MSTVFEKIIAGQLPGRFEWADDICVVFSTTEPVAPGHVMVIPRQAYPKWTDAPAEVFTHVMGVAQLVGQAQERAFQVPRAGVIIAGFEVPHTHVHVIPARSENDCSLRGARAAEGEELDRDAEILRAQLRADGHGANVPVSVGSPALA